MSEVSIASVGPPRKKRRPSPAEEEDDALPPKEFDFLPPVGWYVTLHSNEDDTEDDDDTPMPPPTFPETFTSSITLSTLPHLIGYGKRKDVAYVSLRTQPNPHTGSLSITLALLPTIGTLPSPPHQHLRPDFEEASGVISRTLDVPPGETWADDSPSTKGKAAQGTKTKLFEILDDLFKPTSGYRSFVLVMYGKQYFPAPVWGDFISRFVEVVELGFVLWNSTPWNLHGQGPEGNIISHLYPSEALAALGYPYADRGDVHFDMDFDKANFNKIDLLALGDLALLQTLVNITDKERAQLGLNYPWEGNEKACPDMSSTKEKPRDDQLGLRRRSDGLWFRQPAARISVYAGPSRFRGGLPREIDSSYKLSRYIGWKWSVTEVMTWGESRTFDPASEAARNVPGLPYRPRPVWETWGCDKTRIHRREAVVIFANASQNFWEYDPGFRDKFVRFWNMTEIDGCMMLVEALGLDGNVVDVGDRFVEPDEEEVQESSSDEGSVVEDDHQDKAEDCSAEIKEIEMADTENEPEDLFALMAAIDAACEKERMEAEKRASRPRSKSL